MKRHYISRSKLWKAKYKGTRTFTCHIVATQETSFTLRGATRVTLQHHQNIASAMQNEIAENERKRLKSHLQRAADLRMIRPWSENDPTTNPSVRNPPENWDHISIETNMSRSCYHSKFHKLLPLPRKVTVQLHQKYCPCHEKSVYNLIATSPKIAPATKSDTPILFFDSTNLLLY